MKRTTRNDQSAAEEPESNDERSADQRVDRRTALKSGLAMTASAAAVAQSGRASGGDVPGSLPIVTERDKERAKKITPLKMRAMRDYRISMRDFGGQLSDDPAQLFETSLRPPCDQFDVVVVGSGYGASICAARLAAQMKPGYRLAIIERGREWVPGTFPDTFRKVSREGRSQVAGRKKRTVINPLGLFYVSMNNEINTLSGNGLGGTSLINASAAFKPDAGVFEQHQWPWALRDVSELEPYYQMAARILSLQRTPHDQTSKVSIRRRAAANISTEDGFFDLTSLAVMLDGRNLDACSRNPQGVIQRPCELCGDCTTGCNIGAKNTLVMNYLPMAKRAGAEIYTQMEVLSVEKYQDRYRLRVVYFDDSDCGMTRRYTTITSRMVIIGAGSPSSVEILLRSREKGLCLSPSLGCNWTANGDTIGFVVKSEKYANIRGHGAHKTRIDDVVGPTLQTSLVYSHRLEFRDRILIQDAAIPRALTKMFAMLLGDPKLDASMLMLGMGHDEGRGRITLDHGNAKIDWPGLKDSRFRKAVFKEFENIAKAHGGKYKRLKAFGNNLVTVHPLGACNMSDDARRGVVNHLGQVYDGSCCNGNAGDFERGSQPVHHGLYVADGSIIPTPLGVNPLITICALAERIAANIVSGGEFPDIFV